jgi:hypothetical protein
MTTGYNIREGSAELARRAKVTTRDREVAEAMMRRRRVADLARLALLLIDNQPVTVRFPHPESKQA